jgi:uncharacterized protein YraI
MRTKIWMSIIIISMLLASCNLPVASQPAASEIPAVSGVDVVGTSVELTTVARLTELAGGSGAAAIPTNTPESLPAGAPTSTACVPLVTATVDANVRSGPGTVYDVVGYLPSGGTANIAGRNDANTWWYIVFSGAAGGYAWIAGSVVTASCVPTTVQVVAAPPTPTSPPPTSTFTPEPTEEVSLPPPVAGAPDLTANGMHFSPDPGVKDQHIHVQVSVKNIGTAAAGPFTVAWLSNQDFPGCDWNVSGLAAGASEVLDCTFTYTTAQYSAPSNDFYVTLVVDSGRQVAESNEGNNSRDGQLTVVRP